MEQISIHHLCFSLKRRFLPKVAGCFLWILYNSSIWEISFNTVNDSVSAHVTWFVKPRFTENTGRIGEIFCLPVIFTVTFQTKYVKSVGGSTCSFPDGELNLEFTRDVL